jgi:hypothetical protein
MTTEYTAQSLSQMSVDQLQHIILRNRCLPPDENGDKDSLIQAILHPIHLVNRLTLNDLSQVNIVINVKITDTETELPEILRILRESASSGDRRANIKLCLNEIYQPITAPHNPSIYVPNGASNAPFRMLPSQPPVPIRPIQPVDLSSIQTPLIHSTPINVDTKYLDSKYPPIDINRPLDDANNPPLSPSSPTPSVSPPPRKRTRLSIDQKIEIVKRAKMGLPTQHLIPARTLRNLLQKADEIEASANLLTEEERKQRKNFTSRSSKSNSSDHASDHESS